MRVTLGSGELDLEGELTVPAGCREAAVICHPHPQYGGDMDNSVVGVVASALHDAGLATLRFNFRGVGASGGSYGGGVGEIEDACAAVRFVQERSGAVRITLAGYSFGAMVALRAGIEMPAVDRLIGVAPPLAFFDLQCLTACAKPKLFVVGDRDAYCSAATLAAQLADVPEPKTQRIVRGADHFFYGHESAIAAAVREFVGA